MKINAKRLYRKLMDHLWGPTGSAIIHILVIFALIKLVTYKPQEKAPDVEVVMMDIEETKLDEIQEELEKLKDVPEMQDDIIPPDVPVEAEAPAETDFSSPTPTEDFAALDIQNDISSPLVMRGLFQGRSAGGRSAALNAYGGGFGKFTEAAVLRALEWLRTHQAPDGSWGPNNKSAMTGLGLLTFLAHGETTGSEKYGETVEKAIRYIVSQQDDKGSFALKGGAPDPYEHAIATYGISEAYGMTRIPSLKPVMEKAIQVIVNGQQDKGCWDYKYEKKGRRDTSISGWQIQAMKAAYIAGAEVSGIKPAMDKAIKDLQGSQEAESGLFYYSDIGSHKSHSITAVAVLCMQLLGYGEDRTAKKGVQALQGADCDWVKPPAWPMYAWYYITQAKFHEGGQTWSGWNAKFARVFVKSQNEDGSWTTAGANLDKNDAGREMGYGPVYSTALAALSLQVYYRFLPTYKPIAVAPVTQTDTNDVVIEIL